jgi:hypothetical protein
MLWQVRRCIDHPHRRRAHFRQSRDVKNDLNLGAGGRGPRDKLDEERLSARMRKFRASDPDYRAKGWARMVGVLVASGGRDLPSQAAETYEASAACWKFGRGEKLVEGKKW